MNWHDLEPYLAPDARETIEALRHTNVLQAAMRGPRHAHIDELTSPNVLELPEWRARLHENRLGTIAPAAPVLLHHARQDRIVTPKIPGGCSPPLDVRVLQGDGQSLGCQSSTPDEPCTWLPGGWCDARLPQDGRRRFE